MEYVIAYEHPELCYRAGRHFKSIAEARRHRRKGETIYRVSSRGDDGTPIGFTEVF